MVLTLTIFYLKQDQITDNEDSVNLLFQSTLGKPEYVRLQPSNMIGSLCSFHRCLTLMKKKNKIVTQSFSEMLVICYLEPLSILWHTWHHSSKMAEISKIAVIIPEILAIFCFRAISFMHDFFQQIYNQFLSSINGWLYAKIKTVTLLLPDILAVYHFRAFHFMCENIRPKWHDNFRLPWVSDCIQKINKIALLFPEILHFKESCNPVGLGRSWL